MSANHFKQPRRRSSNAAAKKISANKPAKPYDDFPLYAHSSGQWAKKIRGKTHYFGMWHEPEAAFDLYQLQRDDLYAGRRPSRTSVELPTLADMCNHFLEDKERAYKFGKIRSRTFQDYKRTCVRLLSILGRHRTIESICKRDFVDIENDLVETCSLRTAGNEISRMRMVFIYAFEAELVETPIKLPKSFARAKKHLLRRERASKGRRDFDAAELRQLLDAAGPQLRAMILLGINCGLGNNDCGQLKWENINMDRGWLKYPRPKTGIDRNCPLWPETIAALQLVKHTRPKPKDWRNADLVFITKRRLPWSKSGDIERDNRANPVSAEFRKLCQAAGTYEAGRGFYALRHTFETVGGDSRDQVAVDAIMGHVDQSMAAEYREWVGEERLHAVVNHVRQWVFPEATKKKKKKKKKAKKGGVR